PAAVLRPLRRARGRPAARRDRLPRGARAAAAPAAGRVAARLRRRPRPRVLSMKKVRIAVVGAGYWGINHVRAFARVPGAELRAVCDPDSAALLRAAEL